MTIFTQGRNRADRFALTGTQMAARFPLWFHRTPDGLQRRLELAEATARAAVAEVHAQHALDLIRIMAPRMPFDEALERYVEIMGLGRDMEEIVRNRTLVMLGDPRFAAQLAEAPHRGPSLNWRYATPLGAVRYVRRQLRRSAEEDLWLELAAARAEESAIRAHVEHALAFAELLEEEAAAPRSVSLYIERLEIPTSRATSVYQRTLAQLADTELPRLGRSRSATDPAPAASIPQSGSGRPTEATAQA